MSSLSPPYPEWLFDPSVEAPGTPAPSEPDSDIFFRPPTTDPLCPPTPPLAEHLLGAADSPKTPPPPTNWTTKNLPPLPLLSLPPPAIAIGPNPLRPEPTPLPSHDFRIPRRSPTTAPKSLGSDPGHIPIIDLTAQKHIQRTVKRRETSALRLQRRRGFKPWICEPCGKVCRNSLAKADHLQTRKHLRRTEYKGQHCTLCDFVAKSPEDFDRHIQGRRHKQRIGHHS